MGQRLIFSQIACSASAAASNASSPERYTRLWVSSSSCSAESPLKSNRCGSIVRMYGLPGFGERRENLRHRAVALAGRDDRAVREQRVLDVHVVDHRGERP